MNKTILAGLCALLVAAGAAHAQSTAFAWNYKQDAGTKHIGPMSQDFWAAFGAGVDEKHITSVDADGVALAAIQGLNQKLEEQRAENVELKQQLTELRQLVQSIARKLD